MQLFYQYYDNFDISVRNDHIIANMIEIYPRDKHFIVAMGDS